jgi:Tfp pilus assembly protein FimV
MWVANECDKRFVAAQKMLSQTKQDVSDRLDGFEKRTSKAVAELPAKVLKDSYFKRLEVRLADQDKKIETLKETVAVMQEELRELQGQMKLLRKSN